MISIDNLNEQIIVSLEQNARQSSHTIANKLNISSATVRRRLNQLIKSDMVRIVAVRNPEKTGLPVTVLMGLNVDHSLVDQIMEKIRRQPEVSWACTTTGRFDAFLLARFHSNEDFSKFVRNKIVDITGIKDSETFFCLHVEK